MQNFEHVLEQSTNTHKAVSKKKMEVTDLGDGRMFVDAPDQVQVSHGEHGTNVMDGSFEKINQTEINPISKQLEKRFD